MSLVLSCFKTKSFKMSKFGQRTYNQTLLVASRTLSDFATKKRFFKKKIAEIFSKNLENRKFLIYRPSNDTLGPSVIPTGHSLRETTDARRVSNNGNLKVSFEDGFKRSFISSPSKHFGRTTQRYQIGRGVL